MARTFLMVKPRAVADGLTGEIVATIERHGFTVVGIASRRLTADEARRFYGVHEGKPFYERLVASVTSGMSVGLLLEAPDAVQALRKVVGSTDPTAAAPGTIRSEYGKNVTENAVHASDSPENVAFESAFFFDDCSRALVG
jgi:nucleoside-diphosphate kinase